MKKLITFFMALSLANAAIAQSDDAQSRKKRHKKNQPAAAQNPAQLDQNQVRQPRNAPQPGKSRAANQPHARPHDATTNPNGNTAVDGKRPPKQMKKQRPDAAASAPASRPTETDRVQAGTAVTQPARNRKGKAGKADPQTVQRIKTEHVNFKAQPRPNKVPAVTYNQSYRITGAQQWQGPQYEVFRTYRPQWHDSGWYRTRYPNIQIIAGGAYYFSNGFWFPAWGYDPAYQYYAYDAPIYVGSNAEPPDRVIADVQSVLQDQGYYKGEVDGLLGPLTREALIEYQNDNGLYATAVIDEPTLASLDLS